MTEELIREINEDIARERTMKFVVSYGKHMAVVGVLLLAFVGGYSVWKERDRAHKEEMGDRLYMALREPVAAEREKALASVAAGKYKGPASIARLNMAKLSLDASDYAGAVASYEALANDSGAELQLRDLASYLAAYVIYEHQNDPKKAAEKLRGIIAAGRPFRFSAMELLGYINMQQKDYEGARQMFKKLAGDGGTPETIKYKAQKMLEAIN